jgi:ATP-binding cassette subfamily G (WHITE) protein 2 (SNQ2)
LTGLDVEVGKFWIYFVFIYTTTICITALYRMFAALSPTIDDAVRFSGTALNLLIVFTGYVISKPQLLGEKIWFGWLYYINPISYSFEAVLTNQFSGKVLNCAPAQTVPRGAGYDNPAYQGCAFTGANVGDLSITGPTYLNATYQYSRTHLWRNFGVGECTWFCSYDFES